MRVTTTLKYIPSEAANASEFAFSAINSRYCSGFLLEKKKLTLQELRASALLVEEGSA